MSFTSTKYALLGVPIGFQVARLYSDGAKTREQ